MTIRERDSGYILAGVTVVTLVLSITAAGLLSAATMQLRRAHQLEREVAEQSELRGAVRLVATDLSVAERLRLIDFREENLSFEPFGREATVSVIPEATKLDLNAAPLEVIDARARELGWGPELTRQFLARVESVRRDHGHLGLVDDAIPETRPALPCLHQAFTVFGGRSTGDAQPMTVDLAQRIAPGTRLAITVEVDEFEQAVTAVLLMRGDPDRPAEIMDLRYWPVATKGDCHVVV